jgi:hypothetical protein
MAVDVSYVLRRGRHRFLLRGHRINVKMGAKCRMGGVDSGRRRGGEVHCKYRFNHGMGDS